MTVHKCDICKKEMKTWVWIHIGTTADDELRDMVPFSGMKELCYDCANKVNDIWRKVNEQLG